MCKNEISVCVNSSDGLENTEVYSGSLEECRKRIKETISTEYGDIAIEED